MIRGSDGRPRWHDIWRNLPYLYSASDSGEFDSIVNGPNARPYIDAKTDRQWTWKEFHPPPGEIRFSRGERDFGQQYAGRVVLEPTIKQKASPNKAWPWVNWSKLAWLLQEKHGLRITQLGRRSTPLLDGADHILTGDFRFAATVLANARAVVTHEGAMHHAAAAVGTPAIVIRGGFISERVTGYEGQIDFFSGDDLGCGMRVPCEHCHDAMAAIKPEQVADQLIEILNERVARAIPA